jgi:hypothetical protein
MWASIIALVGGVFPKIFNAWINYRTRKAEVEGVNRSAEIAAALELGQAQIASTSSHFKEWLTAGVILGPLIIAMGEGLLNALLMLLGFKPLPISIVRSVFLEISYIPDSWMALSSTIILAVWGIQAGAGPMAKIFSGVASAWNVRRETASIIKGMDVDRKAIFDGLRNINNGRGFNQETVDAINKVLDDAIKSKEGNNGN